MIMRLNAVTGLTDARTFCGQYRNHPGESIVCHTAKGELMHLDVTLDAPLAELGLREGTLLMAEVWTNPKAMESHRPSHEPKELKPQNQIRFNGELLFAYMTADASDYITSEAVSLVKYWPTNGNMRSTILKACSQLPEYIDGLAGHMTFQINDGILAMEIWESQDHHDEAMSEMIEPTFSDIAQPSATVEAHHLSFGVSEHDIHHMADL